MWTLDPVTVLLFLVITILFLVILIQRKKESVHPNYPPGPKPWPIIGNIPTLNIQKPYLSFQELAKMYGPVYSLTIGAHKIVLLCGYDIVKEALVNHADEFANRPDTPVFRDFSSGYGMAFANGHNWRAMKRFTLATFNEVGVGKGITEDKINEETNCLVQKFKTYKGEPFDNTKIMNAAFCNMIVSIIFGYRFDFDDPELERLVIIVMDLASSLSSPMASLYNTYPSLMRWLPGSHKDILKIGDKLRSEIRDMCTKQRNQLDVNDPRTFIDHFLVKQKKEKPDPELYFHDENITNLVLDLIAAGIETTSTTLSWALLIMMKYPKIQENVQKEIEKVMGSTEPQMAHRKHMPYTDAVIHEVQRFANIVPTNLPHMTTQDVLLKGFFLPKGTRIMPSLTSVLRDDKYFKKPDEFYPEHFLDADGNFVKNEAFIPFSIGRRSCAGEILAKTQLFLMFTKLLQNFTFTAAPGAKLDLSGAVGFISHPKKHEICAMSRN